MMGIGSWLTLNRLRKNITLSQDRLKALQLDKLQAMLCHVYHHVPYYQRLFDEAGVKPQDIKDIGDLLRIPITTRRQIQQMPVEDILAKNVSRDECKRITTGGSSGIPLTVFIKPQESAVNDLVWARTSLENGKRLTDITSYFKFQFPRRAWFESLSIWRRDFIPLVEDTQEKVKRLKRSNPNIIRGNPFELVSLARFIKENSISGIEPRMVFCMGSLLDPPSRELLHSVFKAEVFDFYGATEFGCIAWECSRHQGYHLNVDTVVVEIINQGKPTRPGEIGKIICTGLLRLAMPLIRYDTGDMGIASEGKCACGRNLPLLKSIEGRADDFFISAQGRIISPSMIVNRMKLIPGIGQFRIIQESKEHILIQLAADKNISEATGRLCHETMSAIMGHPIHIDLQIMESIPPDPAGKIRSLISRVEREYQ